MTVLQTAGLSHSEIFGSKVICTYPKLIAAYHVLHRLCEPRHPPYALSYFLLKKIKREYIKQHQLLFILTASPFEAHTFSCQVKSFSLGLKASRDLISKFELSLLYSFACVNMSKIVWTIQRLKAFLCHLCGE